MNEAEKVLYTTIWANYGDPWHYHLYNNTTIKGPQKKGSNDGVDCCLGL